MTTTPTRLVLGGADVVLPDRILERASVVVEQGLVADIVDCERPWPSGTVVEDGRDLYVVPGFVDVHVHGSDGVDVLDGQDALRRVARALTRYGVTAFCPTSVACGPEGLEGFLSAVADARRQPEPGTARVLPAHLESNFIAAAYAGAQAPEHLCVPPALLGAEPVEPASRWREAGLGQASADPARQLLEIVERFRPDVAIVTIAPEITRGLDLVRWLVARGLIVSMGHSGASFDLAMAAIEAGARHATHLFNRMAPMSHREPGLVGAVLSSGAIAAELVCDGYHVHPAVARIAIAAKGLHRMMAVSDGTAGTGCGVGTTVQLGGHPIVVGEHACFLQDGTTLAGSRRAMDEAFRFLVGPVGLSPVQAAYLCSTSACRHLGMQGFGVLAPGAPADLVLLNRRFRVQRTMVAGVWATGSD